ncbi:MAG: Rrf2 family transcriptional regulator [Clostridia bacterium]|nr:Rrf2 family transcriptional regulator [Clostridia bacterium]
MKLSSKARYGIFAVAQLAKNYGKLTSVSELATATGVTEKYLEQIIAILKQNDIVVAKRGSMGGYELSKHPQEITVGQVLRPLENNLEIVDCVSGKCTAHNSKCMAQKLWCNLYANINTYLDSVTLQQLLEDK